MLQTMCCCSCDIEDMVKSSNLISNKVVELNIKIYYHSTVECNVMPLLQIYSFKLTYTPRYLVCSSDFPFGENNLSIINKKLLFALAILWINHYILHLCIFILC